MALHDYTSSRDISFYSRYIATEWGHYHVGWGVASPNFSSPMPCGGSRRYPTETDAQWRHKLQLDMKEFSRRVYCALQFKDYDYKPGD